jgi:hypothetical protein
MLISLLPGCATLDQKINLTYKPVDRPFGRNSGDVLVSRVDPASLLRNTKGEWVIGSLNNANGVKQADLLSDRALGEWVSDALVQELLQAGYSTKYAVQLPSGVARAAVINDISVFMNVDSGIGRAETKQELKFNVDIILNGLKIKTLAIAARDNKTLPLTASQEEKERIMRQSLQDAMQQVMPELIVLFNKK